MKSLLALPRSTLIRLVAFLALVAGGILIARYSPVREVLTEEGIKALVTQVRAAWWGPLVLIVLYVAMAVVALPPVPLLVGGALFGPILGTFYNVLGLFVGAAASYAVARALGHDAMVVWFGQRVRKMERVFERFGFWPLVQMRFLPVPFAVVNYGAALSGVRPLLFLSSALVGLAPSTAIHTFFIARLLAGEGSPWSNGLGYLVCFGVFNLLIGIPWLRQRLRRRERFRELQAERENRTSR